jgi:histidinol-phosphatase (PHP family)
VIVDYHMHLRGLAKHDGAEPLVLTAETAERYVEVARLHGVDEIGFTEHVYYLVQTREVWHLPYHLERCVYDLDVYVEAVLEARRRGLPVKLGIEVDHVAGRQSRLAELLAPYPWDFVLASVHEVGDIAVDQWPGIWESLDVEAVWRGYFASLCELAESGHVDVMAHPDLAKKYGQLPAADVVAELFEQAAASFARAGVAAEISTAGLRKPCAEIYPAPAFLRALGEHGVPITLASDSHQADTVGADFDRAVALARECGYDTLSVFDRRRRRQQPLG